MKIVSVATATPPLNVSQDEALAFLLKNVPMKNGTRTLYEKVFKNKSIQTRRFGMKNLEAVLEKDHDTINQRFQKSATALSVESLNAALKNAGLAATDLDCLITTTCTGYLCPGLSSYIIEEAQLRPDIHYADLTGMGCAAAVPAIQQAGSFVKANPGKRAAVVSTEICSAAMFTDDAADLVISNGIFADGSAAIVLSSVEADKPLGTFVDFASIVEPSWRESIRFITDDGYLRNVLTKEVPERAAGALDKLAETLFQRNKISKNDIRHWLLHSGGEKILESIANKTELKNGQLDSSRAILRERGNMSSPTVLYVLENRLKNKPPASGEWGLLASFGAGFSAHAALVRF